MVIHTLYEYAESCSSKRAAGVLRRLRQGRLLLEVVRKGDLRKEAGDGKWPAALQLN